VSGCTICDRVEQVTADPGGAVYADEHFVAVPVPGGNGVPGWMMLLSRRHVSGVDQLDEAEAAAFGPVIGRIQRAVLTATGAERVYLASLNESAHHLHVHLAPRYARMPAGVVGFAVFDLLRATAAGEVEMDPAEVAATVERVRSALAAELGGAEGGR
jgi:diadenosine tetraphosphate (Ap4A) HIT family hydrolase